MASLKKKDIREILKMFENELNLLIRIDKLEKMEIRKIIKDVIIPISEMDIKKPNIFMDIVEEKLHDVFDLFIDGYEFRKKLERKLTEKLKNQRI
jgi:formylmethanofuran dehydrogenase subunit C